MSGRGRSFNKNTRILCVNCNICVNRLRRYPALDLNPRVAALLASWVYPKDMDENDYICEACRDLLMSAVNDNLQLEISSNDGEQPGPSQRGHINICLLCGCSLLQRQSDKILRENPSELHQSMIDLIKNKVAPWQVTPSDRVCHACWLRTQREVRRMHRVDSGLVQQSAANISQEQEEYSEVNEARPEDVEVETNQQPPTPTVVSVPGYKRAANNNKRCVFPDCPQTTLRSISDNFRAILIKDHRFYIPNLARVCDDHLNRNLWDTLYDAENCIETFTTDQIAHVFSFVNAFNVTVNFENPLEIDDPLFRYWIGYTKEQFCMLMEEVPRLNEVRNGVVGLAILLIKMRTGDSDERISLLIGMPRRTMETLMYKVREILVQDFVPANLGINHLSREQLRQHSLAIPEGLYGNGNNVLGICDGTYIYIHKSSNYMFQKKTYSLHKYRNLVKPFLIVACDGYIIDIYGPYKATTSDADIMTSLFSEGSALRSYFLEDDVFILDRGFRDSISLLEECGYRTCMPATVLEGERQLTTEQANESRCVTLCRWVIEAVNGHFKTNFKLFRQEYFHLALPNMLQLFSIAAALLNRFGVRFQDNVYANEILEIISERKTLENNLANKVEELNMNRRTTFFESITADRNNVLYFPVMEYRDLILFALGTYQIRQARSYYGEHIRFHGGYRIEVSREPIRSSQYNLRGSDDATLIRGRIKSRHVSRKQYYVYVLVENNIPGRTGISEYCCSCLVGRRTIGCCAHVMTIVWYLGWARYQQNIFAPAAFLDDVLVIEDEEE